ncbi:hypothetical protein Ddye_010146 [Dipteronia dyeriana]|uniref:Uncharacterized protein n=1 Tax=Dipteronia dyeriana TaxID=168575 RepID=A0AAD9XCS8_9ROSI|nr:hypothetical protein Ddye_010146 [Dipteronia dyeriana]
MVTKRHLSAKGLEKLSKGPVEAELEIDRGHLNVELGYNSDKKSVDKEGEDNEGDEECSNVERSLREEVAKVMEEGVALGFYFGGNTEKVVVEITIREKEDEERGLGRLEKRREVRRLVYNTKPNLLFIQESKLNYFDSKVIKSLGGALLTKGIRVEAKGSAGGVITLWNEDVFEVKSCISNDRYIIVSGKLVVISSEVVFCNVYAANNEKERVELWNFILVTKVSLPGPWIVGGTLTQF